MTDDVSEKAADSDLDLESLPSEEADAEAGPVRY